MKRIPFGEVATRVTCRPRPSRPWKGITIVSSTVSTCTSGGCDVGRGQLRQDVASHRLESTRRQPLFLDLLHGFPKGIRRPGEEKASRQVAGSKADASPTALLDHPHKPDVCSSLCGQRSRGSISRSERRPNRARRSEMDLKCSLRCLDGGRR